MTAPLFVFDWNKLYVRGIIDKLVNDRSIPMPGNTKDVLYSGFFEILCNELDPGELGRQFFLALKMSCDTGSELSIA